MKKGIFISQEGASSIDNTGIGLKIKNQIKAFNKGEIKCDECILKNGRQPFLKLFYRLPFYNGYPHWIYKKEFDTVDFIYFRRPFIATGAMRNTLKKIKNKNPNIKIIMEIPTYPYDKELLEYKLGNFILWRDCWNRKKLYGIVDRIATLTDDKEIFGIKTLHFTNGIELEDIQIKKIVEKKTDTINLCAVALFKSWHGYERVIKGIGEYYRSGGKRKIFFHLVGEGDQLELYKNIVKEYQIEDKVIFYGFLQGEELNKIYNISDLAMGSFGFYKIGLEESCNLKSRQYIAKGLPIVTGCKIDIFNKKYPFWLEFPNNDTIVDIKQIIDFYDSIHKIYSDLEIVEAIRKYAEEKVDMVSTMKEIISYIITG